MNDDSLKPSDDTTDSGWDDTANDDATSGDAKDDNASSEASAQVEAPEAPVESPQGSGAKEEPPTPGEGAQLLPPGNPLRYRSLAITAVGALGAFLLMANSTQLRFGVPVGALFIAIATFGLMDFLGTFDDPQERVASSISLSQLAKPIGIALAACLLFAGSIDAATQGVLGGVSFAPLLWGGIVTATFIGAVAAIFQLGVALGPWKLDENGEERPLLRRHGFWLIVVAALLYLPSMGIFSLWDPWETHYGLVAREILGRDDWISLWSTQEKWFWSKPILNFWIQAVAMATFGVGYRADKMLEGVAGPGTAAPEWAVRTPNVLFTLCAMYILYKGVARIFGRRAGLLGGIVLATVPDWYFLAHQTMTDMPFVAPMTAAMGCVLIGLHIDEDRVSRAFEVNVGSRSFRFTAWHLVFGVILITAIPQIVYLVSRNVDLVAFGQGEKGFRAHFDDFVGGSVGNCGLPGNEACAHHGSAFANGNHGVKRFFLSFEPSLQALLWGGVLGMVLYINWGERRLRRLAYLAGWYAAALATMGKGPAGFALPMICAFAYIATKKRWSELLKFEIVSGLLLILCVALPWYVAMYMRHGSPFTDRLIFHDMFNRAFSHVHDTNEGDDTSFRFYVWQLGYALFPWVGLAPLALTYWLRRADSADEGRGDTSVFLAMWFLFAFTLFSFMGTKFHHYIFPAVPPIAMLIGIVVDDLLGNNFFKGEGWKKAALGGAAFIGIGFFALTRIAPTHILNDKSHHVWVFGVLATFVAVVLVGRGSREDENAESPRSRHETKMIGAAVLGGALLLVLIGRDLTNRAENGEQPGPIRLLQLFTYNYKRPWPESVDFTAPLAAFAIVAALFLALMAVRRWRGEFTLMFALACGATAIWGIDVYMVKLSPHWGQRELMQKYYSMRTGTQEPIVAYQMNWLGEYYYTSNHIPAFVSSGAPFTKWIKEQKDAGVRVMYFVTEHSRIGGLKSEVAGKAYSEITDKALNNKFVLIRAEL